MPREKGGNINYSGICNFCGFNKTSIQEYILHPNYREPNREQSQRMIKKAERTLQAEHDLNGNCDKQIIVEELKIEASPS